MRRSLAIEEIIVDLFARRTK